MDKFYCPKCKKIFEAEGEKREWQDPVYGSCWKMIARCPICGNKCDEYRPSVSPSKKKGPFLPSCGCSLGK
ncbi:MAG: hypothetical protein ACK413_03425 [Patescibacteria group bacterium]